MKEAEKERQGKELEAYETMCRGISEYLKTTAELGIKVKRIGVRIADRGVLGRVIVEEVS